MLRSRKSRREGPLRVPEPIVSDPARLSRLDLSVLDD